ncbi:MAG: hypothetical protein A2806_01645 [Candidatus Terrybacteria bacterium RIFCSPHIGHO2_01_FULL_48_17]|uniref:Uncharacterized protein n=1 Tax=Candidatus Terrybacteria bacterium RIFCSPHIGHO2_01_FULL_48_17 TaxID=1802362 RepID=A0A1G2PL39_9BACT|nr:MAG: hypothetical protein A2806_01645 [Candidatus Terrybacteria bacterium RIFCSPHIGHO2_01_FULL_48_17]OHA52686.1 MAG: hypothetical protein A3A30_03655 [Candidatus Terrybacteria bacterium RIFCSPLOWO2_01_FULL_48_14]
MIPLPARENFSGDSLAGRDSDHGRSGLVTRSQLCRALFIRPQFLRSKEKKREEKQGNSAGRSFCLAGGIAFLRAG